MADDDVATGEAPDATWFQRVADDSGLVFFILRIRPDVAFEFVNAGMRTQMVGTRPDLSTASAAETLAQVSPDSADALAAMLAMQPDQEMQLELKWRHATGRPVFSQGRVRCRQRGDGSVIVEGALQDVTHLHEVQRDLRNSEKRHRLLAQNAWDVVWTMGLDGSITYISPAVQRVRGFTPAEAMAQSLEQIHPPESAAKVGAYFSELFAAIERGTLPPKYHGEHEYYRNDGSIMTGELQVIPHVDDDGTVIEILGVTRDISERKEFEEGLTRLAVTDTLTGLWNRRRTNELLAADLEQAHRDGQALTVLMVDIDRFKAINDTHGHQTGDRVLVDVANRLRQQVRTTDVVGRWGGEEFVILLRNCGLRDAFAAAEKLRERIAALPFANLFSVSVSIGAAELHTDDDLESWLARADAALYEAKRGGRNTIATG